MKKADIEKLEKITGQLEGLHREITALARKLPNDGVNEFKLQFVNGVLSAANELLGSAYLPLAGFSAFDPDNVPSNSDVTFILTQYLEEAERLRADNINMYAGRWIYISDDSVETIPASPPAKILKK